MCERERERERKGERERERERERKGEGETRDLQRKVFVLQKRFFFTVEISQTNSNECVA